MDFYSTFYTFRQKLMQLVTCNSYRATQEKADIRTKRITNLCKPFISMQITSTADFHMNYVSLVRKICVLVLLFAQFLLGTSTALAADTPLGFTVAFLGDQGLNENSRAVLKMIKNQGADMVVHQGDFDYEHDPDAWDTMINEILGDDFPYFASIGNHDRRAWSGYQRKLQERLSRIDGADCSGDLGVKSACTYKGLFFILSGVGIKDTGHEAYIKDQLEKTDAIWRICSWHANQNLMQVGSKKDSVGWDVYEICREGGAIIATGHEHSYSRTHLLDSFETQNVASTSDTLRVEKGKSFAFVSGIGGHSIRNQKLDGPWWASIYASDQLANYGALFCTFNPSGVEILASCYFMDIDGAVPDQFELISDVQNDTDQNNTGVVLKYDFDQWPNGNLVIDTSGNHIDAALETTTHYTMPAQMLGYRDGGLYFDGTNNLVNVGDNDLLDLYRFTNMAWIKISHDNSDLTVASGGITALPGINFEVMEKLGSYWLYVMRETGLLRAGGRFNSNDDCENERKVRVDGDIIERDVWTHVTSSYDGEFLRVFINGKLAGELNVPANSKCNTDHPLTIGAKYTPLPTRKHTTGVIQNPMNGFIDEVRIYDHALSADEIKEIMNDTEPRVKPKEFDTPDNFTSTQVARKKITLSWEDVDGEDVYIIQWRRGSRGSWKRIRVGADTTSYIHKKLKPRTLYEYRIRAHRSKNAGGNSDWSTIVSVKTL
ncbi:MAG: hypothetical protein GY807_10525 [Gammaproteobacteria bacterium]|nr:hypothetical protein [Gammaproteobacteria bacterium]